MIEVVIFDLDGLLVDSEPLQYKAYNQVFSRHGYPVTVDEWRVWTDLDSRPAELWAEAYDVPLDAQEIADEKKVIYDRLIEEEMELKPGAKQLVETLSHDLRLCVASGSRIESIEGCLGRFGLRDYFERLFSSTSVPRNKPHPDVFLEAASRMGVSPSACVVLEDSVIGLQAAKAARMACIVCPDAFVSHPRSRYREADIIVGSLEEITPHTLRELPADNLVN